MRLLALLALVLLTAGCSEPPSFEEAERIFERGDMSSSITAYTPIADQGDYRAQLRLGWIYLQKGEHQNLQKSAAYFQKAAEAGDPDALWHIGHRYMTGQGLPENSALAEKYLLQSAAADNPDAMVTLGHLYSQRLTTSANAATALLAKGWFKKAYQFGEPSAATFLWGLNLGGPFEDLIEAAAWNEAYSLAKPEREYTDAYRLLDADGRIEARTRAYKYFSEFGTQKRPSTFLHPRER